MESVECISRSKSELKEIRDNKITELASAYSVEDLCYLYNLREARVKEILRTKNIDCYSDRLNDLDRIARNKELKSLQQILCEELQLEGLTKADILYIHQRASTEETTKARDGLAKRLREGISDTNNRATDTELSLANGKVLQLADEEVRLLTEQIVELQSQLSRKDKLIDSYKKEVSKLSKELEAEKSSDNKARTSFQYKLNDKDGEIAKLKSELSSIRESNKKISVKYADTELCLNAQNNRATVAEIEVQKLKEANETLQNRIKRLEYEFSKKSSELDDISMMKVALEAENKILQEQIWNIEATTDRSLNKYTTEEKDRMVKVFISCGRNRTKAIEILHSEGIMVSYKHLGRILTKRRIRK